MDDMDAVMAVNAAHSISAIQDSFFWAALMGLILFVVLFFVIKPKRHQDMSAVLRHIIVLMSLEVVISGLGYFEFYGVRFISLGFVTAAIAYGGYLIFISTRALNAHKYHSLEFTLVRLLVGSGFTVVNFIVFLAPQWLLN
jgi:hypothetical protein